MSKSMSTTGMRVWHVGPGSLGRGASEGPARGGMRCVWGEISSFYPCPLTLVGRLGRSGAPLMSARCQGNGSLHSRANSAPLLLLKAE